MLFETKLLSLHYDDSFSTSSLYVDSPAPLMSPTTVVLSANFTMELLGWVGVQSYVSRVYNTGLIVIVQATGRDLTHIPVESRC